MALEMLLRIIRIFLKKKYFIFLTLLFFYNNSYSSSNFDYYSFINNLDSFSTSFVQYTYNENGVLIRTSKGRLLYKKKSKYILEYSSPNIIKFISDGQFSTTYDEDLEQVIIQSNLDKNRNNIIDILINKELIKEKFILSTSFLNGDNHIKFKPLISDLENNIFLLIVRDNKIKKISFMNELDQSVTMEFLDFKRNIKILNGSFKLDIPDNFDVIIDK
tara:strand:+ start:1772 stop:2425 length:654 start_codon:yes stop_codon:yes gene_type:complete